MGYLRLSDAFGHVLTDEVTTRIPALLLFVNFLLKHLQCLDTSDSETYFLFSYYPI